MNAPRGLEVGPLARGEEEAVLALLRALLQEMGYEHLAATLERHFRRVQERSESAVLVARRDGRPVAVLTISTGANLEFGRYAQIEEVYVAPELRGQGVGRELVAAAERWARDFSCQVLTISVPAEGGHQELLVRHYENQRFRDSGRVMMLREIP